MSRSLPPAVARWLGSVRLRARRFGNRLRALPGPSERGLSTVGFAAVLALTAGLAFAVRTPPPPGAGATPLRPAGFALATPTQPPSPTAAEPLVRPEPPEIAPADLEPAVTGDRVVPVRKPPAVRGLYVSAWAAGSARKRARLLALAGRTEINAFVVDVKDATGYVSYASTVPLARQIGANRDLRVGDVRSLLRELRARDVYPIARIVVFKDPLMARQRPELAIRHADGGTWEDHHGELWVDPYNRVLWDYAIALAREAVELGFAEVQWDYVRFPDVPSRFMRSAVYPAREGRSREDAIRQFLIYSREKLADTGVPVTADVFGLTTSVADDMGIGQRWAKMVDATDVLLPMVYPSHYYRGSYGQPHPNGAPYEVVRRAMEDALARTRGVPSAATIRPWLQDFSLGQPAYGPPHVRAQIEAVYDVGLSEWVLWNPSSNYTEEALAPEGGPAPRFPRPYWTPAPTEGVEGDTLLGAPLPESSAEVAGSG